jgi:hypothetical protein
VLITLMSDFGSVPLPKRLPPAHLQEETKHQLLPLAQTAVACLQVSFTVVCVTCTVTEHHSITAAACWQWPRALQL